MMISTQSEMTAALFFFKRRIASCVNVNAGVAIRSCSAAFTLTRLNASGLNFVVAISLPPRSVEFVDQ